MCKKRLICGAWLDHWRFAFSWEFLVTLPFEWKLFKSGRLTRAAPIVNDVCASILFASWRQASVGLRTMPMVNPWSYYLWPRRFQSHARVQLPGRYFETVSPDIGVDCYFQAWYTMLLVLHTSYSIDGDHTLTLFWQILSYLSLSSASVLIVIRG